MFPIRDNIPSRSLAVITYGLIFFNFLIYFLTVSKLEGYILKYGFIPSVLIGSTGDNLYRIFSSMFLHGGLGHLLSNMIALWIFGDNVEDKLGKLKFLILYFGSGISGIILHFLFYPSSAIPAVGASACISGVIAGYLRYFPFARVDTLVFLGFFITHIQIPALFYIGFWFVTQIQGALISFVSGLAGGVGWYAHLGGFVFGFAFSSLFSKIR